MLIWIKLASHFSSLYKATSLNFNYACKGENGHWKWKQAAKPKAVRPSLSSEDDNDDNDEHGNTTPNVPDVPITSTPITPPESPVEPPSKKSK